MTASATAVVGWLILLIGQLTKRLESGGGHVVEEDQLGRMTKEHGMNQLQSRELSILCRISELLVHEKIDSSERKEEEVTLMMESYCFHF